MTRTRVYWAIALILCGGALAASAALYPGLPDRVPTHWNIHGKVDDYGPKGLATWLWPAVMFGMLGLFAALPWLSPKNFEVDTFRSTYLFIMDVTLGLFAYMHGVTLYATKAHLAGTDKDLDMGRLLIGGVFLFLAVLGNVLGKVRRNFYIGVRVPWTLASDRVWNDTHRLAAWTMVAGGLIGFLLVVGGLSLVLAFGVLIVSVLIPVVYSFVHYKRLERRGAL
jgi:uncharacterized membrane protein